MKKLIAVVIVAVFAGLFWTELPAFGASQYVPVKICHYNTDGTYTQLSLLFLNGDQAKQVGGHIYDKGHDIWPPFTWSGTYTQVNVPGSLWNINYYTPDTVHRAIYNNGCVAP